MLSLSFHFWKSILLLGDSCEGIFLFEGRKGAFFFYIFQNYIFISPKCLIMHCIFVLTIVQLLHNSLHTAQAWVMSSIWGGLRAGASYRQSRRLPRASRRGLHNCNIPSTPVRQSTDSKF